MSAAGSVVLALLACLAAASAALAADAPPTECDQLAAHPADPQRVTSGVQYDLMDWRNAIRACNDGLKANANSPRLHFQLGRALLRGQRRDEALPHLLEAADKGHLAAYALLGNIYTGDLRNPTEGLKWFQRGIERGDETSRLVLGEMYVDGNGIPRNMAEGLKLLEPIAAKGVALAVYKMGVIYLLGDNAVGRDYAKALYWYQRAAALGVARAQNDIGYMVENGFGIAKDPKRAADWYRIAGEQGWGKAQVNLGRMYESGSGVPQDLKEALYWYRLAADSTLEEDRAAGRARVEAIRKRVETTQIAEVDARANKWRMLAAEETVAKLPTPIDSGYRPPTDVAAVDQAYRPPTGPGSAAAGAAPATAAVDKAYAPPQTIEIQGMTAKLMASANVNLRAGPDAAAPLVGRVNAGQEVAVTGRVLGGNWMVIAHEGKTAYVLGSLLKEPAPTQVAAAPVAVIAPPTGVQPASVQPTAPAKPAEPASAPGAIVIGATGQPPAAVPTDVDFGAYYALVIGNSSYRFLHGLKTPRADSEAVAALLARDFGFKVTLLNDATRGDIIGALAKLRANLKWNDNLLVYYAGHGIVDTATERGYWLPVDAEEKVPTNWISTADITDMVRAIEAKHVMVVADACYSGTLMRDTTARIDTARDRMVWLRRIMAKRARTVLSSGGNEPVLDSGGGEHSVFAKAFLNALGESGEVIDGVTLFEKVRRPVVLNSDQTPQYADIRNAGHDGGEFVFVRPKKIFDAPDRAAN
ncbi:MAG: SEL1-like repeat protein [Alphaproteobacteria bacterium]|nr:SEL1-like repeat protein [Alphaproteobacteria bacterium]